MEICLYGDEQICSFDIKRTNESKDYEFENKIREAGRKGLLKCPECNQEVILRAGKIRVPYFAHKKDNHIKCHGDSSGETVEHKKAKFVLYRYFKERYKEAVVIPGCRLEGNRKTDIYVKLADGKEIAIEFERSSLEIDGFEKKHKFYKSRNIKDYWLLSSIEKKVDSINEVPDMSFFDKLMLHEMNDKKSIYLNADTSIVHVFCKLEREGFESKVLKLKCRLEDMKIDYDGIRSDVLREKYVEARKNYERECNQQIQKEMERKRKIEKEKKILEEKNSLRTVKMQDKKRNEYRVASNGPKEWWYLKHVQKVLNYGDEFSVRKLKDAMHLSLDHINLIRRLFEREQRNGYSNAVDVYNSMIDETGFDDYRIET